MTDVHNETTLKSWEERQEFAELMQAVNWPFVPYQGSGDSGLWPEFVEWLDDRHH